MPVVGVDPLTITASSSIIDVSENPSYTVSGGSGFYNVSASAGWVDNQHGSGSYATSSPGYMDEIILQDMVTGEVASVSIESRPLPPIAASLSATSGAVGDTIDITLSGGSGNFYAWASCSGYENHEYFYGSHSYTIPSQCAGQTVDFMIYESNYWNDSTSAFVTVAP